jgi:hypothetical protein
LVLDLLACVFRKFELLAFVNEFQKAELLVGVDVYLMNALCWLSEHLTQAYCSPVKHVQSTEQNAPVHIVGQNLDRLSAFGALHERFLDQL